jgi:hypothetical protein
LSFQEDHVLPAVEPIVKRFVLSAGHRNFNTPGALNEADWTYPSVVALKEAIECRGGRAWIIQEEAGGADPTFFEGSMQEAAEACVALAATHGPFHAYISSHYNVTEQPSTRGGFHVIFPDDPNGASDDIKANNQLSVRLCRTIREHIEKTGTVGILSWAGDSPGVMSEKDSRVGSTKRGDTFLRLREFVGTTGFRETTARIILEAGNYSNPQERAYIDDPTWVRNVYCEAIVDSLEEVFGDFRVDIPNEFHESIRVAELDQFATSSLDETPPCLMDDRGTVWVRHMQEATIQIATHRFQSDDLTGIVGPNLNPGDRVFIPFMTLNDSMKMVGYTFPDAARIDLSMTDVITLA